MASLRDRFAQMGPEEYEQVVRQSAALAKELADALDEKVPEVAQLVLSIRPGPPGSLSEKLHAEQSAGDEALTE